MTQTRNRSAVSARARRMSLFLCAGVAVSVSFLAQQARGQFVWTGAATGPFSNSANWLNTAVPPVNVGTTSLTFSPGNIGAGVNATQDLPGLLLQLHTMTFNNMSVANTFLVGNNTSSSKVFEFDAGASPATINMQGYGFSQTSSGIAGAQMKLTTDLRITGSGMGNLTLNNPVFEDGTPRKLIVANTPATPLTGIFTLASAGTLGNPTLTTLGNTFSGDLVLDGGTVGWSGGGPGEFGTGRFVVTSNGGELFANGNTVTNGMRITTMRLDGNLRVIGTSAAAFNLVAPNGAGETAVPTLSGAGNLLISGQSANVMGIATDSSGYTGTVTLDRFDVGVATGTSGGFQLYGTNGNVRGVSTFNVRNGGVLNLTSAISGQAANNDRIANTATVNLASGRIALSGTGTNNPTQVNVTEVVGTVNGAGFSTLSADSASGATNSTTLNVESLSRAERGTFLFRGSSLASGTLTPNATPNTDGTLNFDGTANTGYVVLPASLSSGLVGGDGSLGTNGKILPYAVGDTSGVGTTFVALDAIAGAPGKVSARPLAASEYATSLSGDATNNVQLTASAANNGSVTVNSLVLTANGANHGSVTGTGTIAVTSGAILAADPSVAASISNNVDFGAVEGQVYTPGAGGLTITGNLTGTGGLTKSGGGTSNNTLFLRGDNSGLTGPLTINAGVIDFNTANALPGTGPIVTNGAAVGTTGSAAGLHYTGTVPYTLSRDVAANTGWVTFKALDTVAGGGNLTIAGQISGNAGVNLQSTVGGADIYVAPTAGFNTYTGPTRMAGGNIHFGSDAALGNGGELSIEGATAVLEGDWTTSRIINNGGATINTNGHNAVLNGPMMNFSSALAAVNTAALTKVGAGSLTLNSNANALGGPIAVNAGSLIINGTIPGSANAVTAGAGGTLGGSGTVWRNVSISSGATLSPGSVVGGAGAFSEFGNLTLASGSTLAIDLNGASLGTYDQVLVSRGTTAVADLATNVTIGGANLAVTLGYLPSGSDLFFILTKDGTTPVSGVFNGLSEGATVSLGTWNGAPISAQISYLGNSATNSVVGGNDVVLFNVVPAPGALALLGIGGLLAVRRRRAAR